ncbi:alpha/beta hydrolase domain-containing protein [Lentzea sp. JNUCC 0626]|uniref:alpha/beta hydrolase domain-containing protein n=1 Tax=Lentzea sp. JNUCC 0626 TaxID=3367513 RepID=UPI0037491A6A
MTGEKGAPVLASHTTFDLARFGYVQSEYFVAGVAEVYASAHRRRPTAGGLSPRRRRRPSRRAWW